VESLKGTDWREEEKRRRGRIRDDGRRGRDETLFVFWS